MHKTARIKKEIEMLQKPPPGISCWPSEQDKLDHFEAQIVGGADTPYEGGVFHLDIKLPERYPFEPPKVQFITPIYHPNVDTAGRICLDLLKMPPAGSWKPSWNISTMLTSIQLLMADPNPDDPLMVDIATEFKTRRPQFEVKAREWTQKHAIQNTKSATNVPDSSSHSSEDTCDSESDSSEEDDDKQAKENKSSSSLGPPKSKLGLRRTGLSRKRTLKEANSVEDAKKEKV